VFRGSEHSATPMPGIGWEKHSPLTDLVPIESVVGLSKDKGKSKEQTEMEEGKSKKAHSLSLTISEFEGAFCGGEDSVFVYNWIDDEQVTVGQTGM
jgi:hypothetical protein